MATNRLCDLCNNELTNEHAVYDLDGRYRFKLLVAERFKWWRGRKETHELDVCSACVRELGRRVTAAADSQGTDA